MQRVITIGGLGRRARRAHGVGDLVDDGVSLDVGSTDEGSDYDAGGGGTSYDDTSSDEGATDEGSDGAGDTTAMAPSSVLAGLPITAVSLALAALLSFTLSFLVTAKVRRRIKKRR